MAHVLAEAQSFNTKVVDINHHTPHNPIPHRGNNAPLASDPTFIPDGRGIMPVIPGNMDAWADSSKHPARLYRAAGNANWRMRKAAPEGSYVTSAAAGRVIYGGPDGGRNDMTPGEEAAIASSKKSALRTFPDKAGRPGIASDMPDWLQAQQDPGLAPAVHDLITTKMVADQQLADAGFQGDCANNDPQVGRVWGKNLKSSLDAPLWLVGAQHNPNEGKQASFAEHSQGLAPGSLDSQWLQPVPARPASGVLANAQGKHLNRKVLSPPAAPILFSGQGHSSNQTHSNAMANAAKARGPSLDMPAFLETGNVDSNKLQARLMYEKEANPEFNNMNSDGKVDVTRMPMAGKAYVDGRKTGQPDSSDGSSSKKQPAHPHNLPRGPPPPNMGVGSPAQKAVASQQHASMLVSSKSSAALQQGSGGGAHAGAAAARHPGYHGPPPGGGLSRSASHGSIVPTSKVSILDLMGMGKKKLAAKRQGKQYDLGPHVWDMNGGQPNVPNSSLNFNAEPTPFVPPKARDGVPKRTVAVPSHLQRTTGEDGVHLRGGGGGSKMMYASPGSGADSSSVLHGANPVTAGPLARSAPPARQHAGGESISVLGGNDYRTGNKGHHKGSAISLGATPVGQQQSPDRPGRGVPPTKPGQVSGGGVGGGSFNQGAVNPLEGKASGGRPGAVAGDQTRSGWMGPGGSHLTDYHKIVTPCEAAPPPRIGCHYFGM